jgi:hypothetical protein
VRDTATQSISGNTDSRALSPKNDGANPHKIWVSLLRERENDRILDPIGELMPMSEGGPFQRGGAGIV